MDLFKIETASSELPATANSKFPAMASEETASGGPTSMVIGGAEAAEVGGQVHLAPPKPLVVPDTVFHRLQDRFGSLATTTTTTTSVSGGGFEEQQETSQATTQPFRRIHDNAVTTALTPAPGDVPSVSHIGVFVKGDGIEEVVSSDDGLTPQQDAMDYANLLSPSSSSSLRPMSECRVALPQQQALVGRAASSWVLPSAPVTYSLECTEDVDGCSSYQLGKHWERGNRIGWGRSGTCYVAVDVATKQVMVVKQISVDHTSHDDTRSEVEVMQQIRHENIVRFYGVTRSSSYVNIFMELMAGGSLEERLRDGAFGEETICHYCRQLVLGLCHLHERGVAHRDIKGGNLLTDVTGKTLKIADFGAAAHVVRDHHKFREVAGTPPYMAPEVVRANTTRGYGMKCDVWSLGGVVIEMATTRPPWVQPGQRNHDRWAIIYKIGMSEVPPRIPSFGREALRDFTIQCLRLDSEDRPASHDLLYHCIMMS